MLEIVLAIAGVIGSVAFLSVLISKRREIAAGIGAFYGRYSAWGRFWLSLGVVLLAAAAAMSFDFGWGVSAKHAIFLAGMSFVTAFIPDAAYEMWNERKRGASLAIAACSLPLFGLEFFSHAGYTAGLRGINVSETRVQNTKYDAAQAAADEEKQAYDMMARRLAKLTEENGWAATVTADSLRARLPGLDLAISQEEARGGCKQKCLDRTKERDDVKSRIAVLEERSELQKKLEAARTWLDKRRKKADTTEHKSSAVEHQNAFLTKAVALTVNGTLEATAVQAEKVQQAVNLGMALAGTGLPALCFFAAGLYRRRENFSAQPQAGPAIVSGTARPSSTHTVETKLIDNTDYSALEKLEALRKAFAQVGKTA